MPRHPPIALKTLDRSHCQCPPARSRRDRRFVTTLRVALDVIGTKRPASRDRFEGAVRQTHHMREIERLPRQITDLADHEVRTNLLFTMSNRTGGEPKARRKLFLRMTFSRRLHLTQHLLPRKTRQSCGLRVRQTATRRLEATIPRIARTLTSQGGRLKRQSCGLREWWSRTGSNRRHPACKAGALPAELRPLIPLLTATLFRDGLIEEKSTILADCEVVGLGGLEPPTSRLSSARSNQLSYKP